MLYRILRFIARLILEIFYSLEVKYEKNLPEGACIFVANHQSLLDPVVVVCSVKRPVIFLASSELYKIIFLKPVLKIAKAIPIKKNSPDLNALKQALSRLKEGDSIGLFPEGGISPTGKVKKMHEGAMYLAYKSGKPIVPIAILGTYSILPFGTYIPKIKGKIRVKIGEPIYPNLNIDIKAEIGELRDKVMQKILKMLEE
ncbi:phospholipid/glycerol acyltransferase [Thermoanaerobacter mathranii subsp. mathranii str. A3]|uniref:Phospholipid/glycerol acyltransferase n=1 Tax=Thermoanaerobacter mathranii subsp. mathranii (strain DSM 11426 / CCUG 53645 / CIP 108742 / A3) TaxID=583358 RepID=A0ABN3Z6N7_THEM3|nr:lysophospholipid acyltransferase family protein [Thermoanaerobacter mathranii]ADH61560.1 phospholipid/glycerol acyltransferase [Thermoanaerobacter mathranii subsp. mathranii str. A3]